MSGRFGAQREGVHEHQDSDGDLKAERDSAEHDAAAEHDISRVEVRLTQECAKLGPPPRDEAGQCDTEREQARHLPKSTGRGEARRHQPGERGQQRRQLPVTELTPVFHPCNRARATVKSVKRVKRARLGGCVQRAEQGDQSGDQCHPSERDHEPIDQGRRGSEPIPTDRSPMVAVVTAVAHVSIIDLPVGTRQSERAERGR